MSAANTELLIKIKSDLGSIVADMNKVSGSIDGIDKSSEKTNRTMTALGSTAKLFTGFFAVGQLVDFSKGVLETNRSMEMLRAQLISITGSAPAAANAFKFIQDFAANTPFEIDGLTKAFIQLQNYGIKPTTEVMNAITNQAAKLGASQETLSGITTALGQAYAKGKLQAEEMMQLAERGVPVYDLLAEVTGKNSAQLLDMASKGELTRDVIDKLIKKMGEMATGANAAAMDTLNGKISNLADSWHTFEDALLQDKSEGIMKRIVDGWTQMLNAFSDQLNRGTGVFGKVEILNEQIARLKLDIKESESGLGGGVIGKATLDSKKNQLSDLQAQRDYEIAAVHDSRGDQKRQQDAKDQVQATAKKLADETAAHQTAADAQDKINKKLEKSAQSKAEAIDKAYKSEREAVAKNIEQLNFELTDLQLSDQERQIQIKLRSLGAKATAEERLQIEASIRAIDKETAAKSRQEKMWAQSVEDHNAAGKQRTDNADLIKYGDVQSGFNTAIADTRKQLDEGIITQEQAKIEFDKLGRAYNDEFIAPAKAGTSELSEFSIQAARNMESTFADFLFDPFADGMDGMAANFAKVLKRMAAEAASAQIFNALLGKDYEKSGIVSGLLGAVVSGVGGMLGGMGDSIGGTAGSTEQNAALTDLLAANKGRSGAMFADGGAFDHGRLLAFADGGVVNRATTFPMSGGHTGLMGEAGPEAIMPLKRGTDGKLGITVSGGSNGNVNITTQVNVTGGGNNDAGDMGKLGTMVNAAVKRVIVDEKRPGGLLAGG